MCKVLRATEEYVQDIATISSEVAREDGMVKEFKAEEIKELLLNKNYYIVIGEIDKEVVGYVISTYSWGKLHILDIAVKKVKRNMGIGKMLVKHLISHAVEKGLSEAYCEVRVRNIAALNLFTSLGFKFRIYSRLVEEGLYGLYLHIKCHSRP